jgi:cell division protein FtsQ
MNRRRTIARSRGLLRRLRGPANRRLAPARRSSGPKEPAPPRDWRGLGRRLGRFALGAAKLAGLLAVLGGVGLGGYHGYRRAMAGTTFRVKQIDIEGARRAPRQELERLIQTALGRNILSVDLGALSRALLAHPWVKRARVSRQLPSRIVVQVEEHRPEALLHLGYLYLLDGEGKVFKRAAIDETEGLPVITGVDRAEYLAIPEACQQRVRRALEVLARYHAEPRPVLSEINLGSRDEITLHLRQDGLAVHLGPEPSAERLGRFDAVWASLGPEVRRVRAVFLDNEVRTDRVIVRMSSNE